MAARPNPPLGFPWAACVSTCVPPCNFKWELQLLDPVVAWSRDGTFLIQLGLTLFWGSRQTWVSLQCNLRNLSASKTDGFERSNLGGLLNCDVRILMCETNGWKAGWMKYQISLLKAWLISFLWTLFSVCPIVFPSLVYFPTRHCCSSAWIR